MTPTNTIPLPENGRKNGLQDSVPKVTVDTKFNQGYRVASPVNGGGEVVAVANAGGQVELFTLGSDGTIWNFYPDTSSDTGYSGVSTTLKGTTFAAGADKDGHIVLFAATGLVFQYVTETGIGKNRWSKPATIEVPQPRSPVSIERIVVQDIAGQLYVALLTGFKSIPENSYSLAYSIWNTKAPSFTSAAITFSGVNGVWTGKSATTAAFTIVQNLVVSYNISNGSTNTYAMTSHFRSVGTDYVTDKEGNDQLFAILEDGNINRLVANKNGKGYYWSPLSVGMIFHKVAAVLDGKGKVNVFGVAGNNRLYHWLPDETTFSGFTYPPAPISTNVSLMGLTLNDGGAVDVFTLGTTADSLWHLVLEEETMEWSRNRLEVPVHGTLEEYISYSTDITAYDAAGLALANVPVKVYASAAVQLTINGATYRVDAQRPALLSTNQMGMLTISQPTQTLAIPVIEINYTGLMPANKFISIDQSADVQGKLDAVKGTDLMEAKNMKGEYMIGDDYRKTKNTDSMAQAFNGIMKTTQHTLHTTHALKQKGSRQKGVALRSTGVIADATLTGAVHDAQHWVLAIEDDQWVYTALTRESATQLLTESRQQHISVGTAGFPQWISSIGDFVMGIVDKVLDVVKMVVTAVGNALHAVITFVIDGITYLFDTMISVVQQALDLVEVIFARVKVILENVWEWIGFLFAWDDILRTREAVVHMVDTFFDFTEGALTGIRTFVDNGFANFKSGIEKTFKDAIKSVAGEGTIGDHTKEDEKGTPEFYASVSNNVVLNQVTSHGSAIKESKMLQFSDTEAIGGLFEKLTALTNNTQSTKAFDDAKTYFNSISEHPDQFLNMIMAGLLSLAEGIALAIVEGVQAVVDALLEVAKEVMSILKARLHAKIEVPVITALYASITNGSALTLIDVIGLMTAIPVTFTYKILFNKTPLADEAAVTGFKNAFNARVLLQRAGFAPVTMDAALGSGLELYQTLFAATYFVGTFVCGVFTSINDGFVKDAPVCFSVISFVFNIVAQIAGTPWIYSSGPPLCPPGNSDGSYKSLWIILCLGIVMDGCFLYKESRLPENTGDGGVIARLIFTTIFYFPAAMVAVTNGARPLDIVNIILPVVPEFCKFLRLKFIMAASEGSSQYVLAVGEFLIYTVISATTFMSLINPASPENANVEIPVLAV